MTPQAHDEQESLSSAEPAAERIARMLIVGSLGGILAGILVGGMGSRLIMRILAMVNEDKAGVMTENGNIAGDIIVGGTSSSDLFRV